jgi:pyridoxal phosphate enzyme (YggS family)
VSISADEIAARKENVLVRIRRAAERRGRDARSVTLLAVTKTHPPDVVRQAARAGITHFGENRVPEGADKIEAVRGEFPELIWHLIGPLQTNKAKPALQYFSIVESLDRERLATRLEGLLAPDGRSFPVLMELNLGDEATKSGVTAENASALAQSILAQTHLDLRGVMSVPPFTEDPEQARPYFRQLVEIRDRLAGQCGRPLPVISMGMSHDFEIAVEEGATQVRIGTELFGPRETR